jgi:hypothetical protein
MSAYYEVEVNGLEFKENRDLNGVMYWDPNAEGSIGINQIKEP